MKRTLLGSLLLTSLLFMLGCSNQPSDEGYQEPINIRLAIPMQPSSALSIIAAEKSFFKERGLDIITLEFPSGKRALLDGLLLGNSDVAFTSDVPVAAAALTEKPIRVVATTFLATDVNRIIARKDRGIASPIDLKGKKIATQKASAVHFFLSLFLSEYRLRPTDFHHSFLKAEELPAALVSGSIDAFSMREPYISQAAGLLGDNAVIFSAPGLYQQYDAVVVNESFVRSGSEAIYRLLKALTDAELFASDHPEEAISIVAMRLGTSRESIKPLWKEHALKLSMDQSYLLLLEDISRWMVDSRLVDGSASPDYLRIIDTGPLERIDPNRVSLIR
ncbi:ABC transporter substrate-binding protein [Pseudomonadota bacterium]